MVHDDWSIRLGENRPDRDLKHLAAILTVSKLVDDVSKILIEMIKRREKKT